MKKGIYPLIASVILIDFVIAIGSIAVSFFTGFSESTKIRIDQKKSGSISCALAALEIDKNQINTTNSLKTDLSGLKIIAYNETGAYTYDASPSSISVGSKLTITSDAPGGVVTKINVYSENCPGVEAVAEKEDNKWETTG